jgi:hypothetical protein
MAGDEADRPDAGPEVLDHDHPLERLFLRKRHGRAELLAEMIDRLDQGNALRDPLEQPEESPARPVAGRQSEQVKDKENQDDPQPGDIEPDPFLDEVGHPLVHSEIKEAEDDIGQTKGQESQQTPEYKNFKVSKDLLHD